MKLIATSLHMMRQFAISRRSLILDGLGSLAMTLAALGLVHFKTLIGGDIDMERS